MKDRHVNQLRNHKGRNTPHDDPHALAKYGGKLGIGNQTGTLHGRDFKRKIQDHKTIGN